MEEKELKSHYMRLGARLLFIIIGVIGAIVLYKLAIFYIPFLIAFIIATIAEPIIKFFMKRCKFKRIFASIITLVLITAIIAGLLTLLISNLVTELTSLLANLGPHVDNVYDFVKNIIDDVDFAAIEVPAQVMDIVNKSLGGFFDSLKNVLFNLISTVIATITSIPTLLTNIFITILAVFFICIDRDVIKEKFNHHLPKQWILKTKKFVSTACSATFKYIKVESKLSLLCFVFVLIGLGLIDLCGLDVGYPVIWALVIGFVDLLPLFGAGAVMLPYAIYSAFTGNIVLAIAIFSLWILWSIIKQMLEPKVLSKEIGVHPIFTLIAMYTGFKLGGVIGLILGPIILLIFMNVFSKTVEKGVFKTIFDEE
ncbi:MAG: sporulation integral membrane protein YtvI [Clostridia bacterium]